MERLQKVIANAGYCSRRKAEELIAAGRVTVNGKVITELGYKVADKDDVEVEGHLLEKEQKVYFVINKPRGCISAVSDDKGRPVVVDYLVNNGVKERIFPVGRLDYDTSGVLIITNDGELSNLLTHPSNKIDKVYLVRCEGIIDSVALMRLRKGVEFNGHKSAPAKVELVGVDRTNGSSQVRITIHEGKYHQVKEMFAAVGYPVKKLRRERYAFIDVQGLKPGDARRLKIHEVKQLYALAQYGKENTNLFF
jgi:23S rRNA pseudouridine2605 synthase